jgi:hypothetical protein
MNVPKRETPLMLEAFNYYLKLGKDRGLTPVTKQFHKSMTWAMMLSKTFRWKDRAEEWDKKQASKEMDLFSKEALIKSKKEHLEIIQEACAIFKAQLQNRKAKMSPTDYEKLAKLDLLMRGDATERVDNLGSMKIDLAGIDDETLKNLAGEK